MAFASRYGWWIGSMAGLAVLLQVLAQAGVLGPAQGVVLTAGEPVERLLTATFQPVANFLSTDAGELRGESSRLREEVADLQRRLAEQQVQNERIAELEAALGIVESDTTATYVAATRIGVDRSPGRHVITINKGNGDGLREGMVVLSAQQTVIGRVIEVFDGHAFVMLLNDSRTKVNARILESDVAGTLSGSLGGTLSLLFVQASVRVGDTVLTSGLGGRFPPDLLLGRVSQVSGSAQDLYRDIEIEPAVRLSTVETVLVLTSFVPAGGP